MNGLIARFFRAMGFEAATGGRRLKSSGTLRNPPLTALMAQPTVLARARYLVENDGFCKQAVRAFKAHTVGAGFTVIAESADTTFNEDIAKIWWRAQQRIDFDDMRSFANLTGDVASEIFIAGECFAILTSDDAGRTQVRIIPAEQVPNISKPLENGHQVISGIEFDADGRKVAYHILKTPATVFAHDPYNVVRVPADDVLHIFEHSFAGQIRGISRFASVMLTAIDFSSANDALLKKVESSAMVSGVVTDINGQFGGIDVEQSRAGALANLEPGSFLSLNPGEDVKFPPLAEMSEAVDFIKLQSYRLSSGLGMPNYLVSGQLSEVNFSSIRASLISWFNELEMFQSLLVRNFVEPVWRRWLIAEVVAGRVHVPGFWERIDDYLSADFLPPKKPFMQPLEDAQAEIALIDAGLLSRSQALAARGYSVGEIDAQRAADEASEKSYGLEPEPEPKPMVNNAQL